MKLISDFGCSYRESSFANIELSFTTTFAKVVRELLQCCLVKTECLSYLDGAVEAFISHHSNV